MMALMIDISKSDASGRHGRATAAMFVREELNRILDIYGRMVAAGEWRDYAIDADRDRAVFSIFRRASEGALYRLVKMPTLASRQGAYMLLGMDGRILKRGHSLGACLAVLERKALRLA